MSAASASTIGAIWKSTIDQLGIFREHSNWVGPHDATGEKIEINSGRFTFRFWFDSIDLEELNFYGEIAVIAVRKSLSQLWPDASVKLKPTKPASFYNVSVEIQLPIDK